MRLLVIPKKIVQKGIITYFFKKECRNIKWNTGNIIWKAEDIKTLIGMQRRLTQYAGKIGCSKNNNWNAGTLTGIKGTLAGMRETLTEMKGTLTEMKETSTGVQGT